MPKLIISTDGVVVKEVQLTKDRTTVGRRPYNDVVLDHLAVSGEHAVLLMHGGDTVIEDLNSTNGTYVNGKAIQKQRLQDQDRIEIGRYAIQFLAGHAAPRPHPTAATPPTSAARAADAAAGGGAAIRVLTGPAAGREVKLVKVVTTLGKPGVAVASITRRPHGYVVALVEGQTPPKLNGQTLGTEPQTLQDGDTLELAGTQMRFVVGE